MLERGGHTTWSKHEKIGLLQYGLSGYAFSTRDSTSIIGTAPLITLRKVCFSASIWCTSTVGETYLV